MYSTRDDARLMASGCPIRISSDQSLLSGSPKLFAASHVLHRLLAPRYPPYALRSLTTFIVATKCAFNEPVTRMQLSKNHSRMSHLRVGSTISNPTVAHRA